MFIFVFFSLDIVKDRQFFLGESMPYRTLDIVIASSFSPYVDSFNHLKKTLSSFDLITDLSNKSIDYHVVIALDGLNPKIITNRNLWKYRRFVRRVTGLESDLISVSNRESLNPQYTEVANHGVHSIGWGHLSGSLCHAFDYFVESRFVLVVQEDLPFVRDIPLLKIMAHLESDQRLKYVRFNRRVNQTWGADSVITPYKIEGENYLKVNNWSDNNHLMKTEDYVRIILPSIRDEYTYPEVVLGPLNLENPEIYGTYIYGSIGDPPVIKHLGSHKHRIRKRMEGYSRQSSNVRFFIHVGMLILDFIRFLMKFSKKIWIKFF